jgi:SAM-dependent methyltransferase
MISDGGYDKFNIWEHSARVKELYRRRCRLEEPEMDCAVQATDLLRSRVSGGDSVLDAGCGSGYFFHSLNRRIGGLRYFGIDAAESLIAIGRAEMPAHGCPVDSLRTMRIEDLDADVDHSICLNVLSNIDNYHRPLERLLLASRRSVIIRESCWAGPSKYLYVHDQFLDPDVSLNVHVNTYNIGEICEFARARGFSAEVVTDHRTGGRPELVIGYEHHWTFLVFQRNEP